MKLNATNETPPVGFSYVQFETGHRFIEPDYQTLIEAVIIHRQSNNVPRGTIQEVTEDINDQICQRSPGHVCRGADFEPAQLSARTVYDAMTALAGVWQGVELVPLDESERRADLCRRCFHNNAVTGCFGNCSQAFAELFALMNRNRTTSHDSKLMGCEICGCNNAVTVHYPISVLRKSTLDERQKYFNRVPHCWRSENNVAKSNP